LGVEEERGFEEVTGEGVVAVDCTWVDVGGGAEECTEEEDVLGRCLHRWVVCRLRREARVALLGGRGSEATRAVMARW